MVDNNNVGANNRIGEGLLMNNRESGIVSDITLVYSDDEPGSIIVFFCK